MPTDSGAATAALGTYCQCRRSPRGHSRRGTFLKGSGSAKAFDGASLGRAQKQGHGQVRQRTSHPGSLSAFTNTQSHHFDTQHTPRANAFQVINMNYFHQIGEGRQSGKEATRFSHSTGIRDSSRLTVIMWCKRVGGELLFLCVSSIFVFERVFLLFFVCVIC